MYDFNAASVLFWSGNVASYFDHEQRLLASLV